MLYETGRVVAVEHSALWVETIRQSVCGNCTAKKGCGQRLLSQFGAQPHYLRVLLSSSSTAEYKVDDKVTIGIPEMAVVKASLLVYLLPLVMFVLCIAMAHFAIGEELVSIAAGMIGLVAGGLVVRLYTFLERNNADFQPQIID